jgi:RNA-binding protein YlmH
MWYLNVLEGTSLNYLAWGGFKDAERLRLVIDGSGRELTIENTQISLIQAIPSHKEIILGHRDILGSLIGLGLKREVIGDIRQAQTGSVIALTNQIEDYVLHNWDSVGRENIKVGLFDPTNSSILPVPGEEKRIVTASSRLDSIAATGFGISRSVMQVNISQGKVKRNDVVILKPEVEVRADDIISCRGIGRLKILDEDSKTRKGKYAWRIFIFKDIK